MSLRSVLVVLALLAAGLAGCSSSRAGSVPTTSATPTTAVVTTVPAGGGGTGPGSGSSSSSAPPTTSSSPSTVAPGPQPCQTADLAGSVGQSNGAAGTVYYPLVLRNTGLSACTLSGYPGVSFVTGPSGSQVGAAADRSPGSVVTVDLPPAGSAQATLAIADAGNFPSSCQITPVAGLRVYPPGQTASLYIPLTVQACANQADVTLHVGPMTAA